MQFIVYQLHLSEVICKICAHSKPKQMVLAALFTIDKKLEIIQIQVNKQNGILFSHEKERSTNLWY